MTRSAHEQKEDIRLRMSELEKKLAESEEERCKLEKTCNVLMRAFREEEKLHYKALNKRYEKFLEDCSVRRRRNEIILKSLCRIEDRSRALFAKTERLKLLRDRYISYLRMNQFKQEQVSSEFWRNLPVTSKPLRWSTPALGRPQEGLGGVSADFLSRADRLTADSRGLEGPPGVQEHQGQGIPNLNYQIAVELKSEEMVRSRTLRGVAVDGESREGGAAGGAGRGGHAESLEVRSPRSEPPDPNSQTAENEGIRPNGTDPVTARSNSSNGPPRLSEHVVTSGAKGSALAEEHDVHSDGSQLSEEQPSPRTDGALPRGLDGVDYQNETYPESYYEQPVRPQNLASIASDVILEEDETEQEGEGGEEVERGVGSPGVRGSGASSGGSGASWGGRAGEGGGGAADDGAGGEGGSGRSSLGRLSGKDPGAKTSLMHMLESDSESFQIEHGDGVSGNEDSDFDFSFNKN